MSFQNNAPGAAAADQPAGEGPTAPVVSPVGHVTLVGAGPGDPELLTRKAYRALQTATLVLYDHLVGPAVLDCIAPGAERIYVGKESSRHTLPQEQIIELMVRLARSGRNVVRLQALAEAGIGFDVVPGITAAQGAGASVGIPLTHRDHACTLVFATGHLREDRTVGLDWELLARPRQTVVIYMGVGALPAICSQLIAHGLPADTPAAVVENATLPTERCLTATLATLPALAVAEKVQPPALIMVGQVVQLHPLLARPGTVLQTAQTAQEAKELATA